MVDTTDIISAYLLDDNAANTAVDDKVNANEGTLGGGDNTADLSVAGVVNNNLNFNGSDDYVDTNGVQWAGTNQSFSFDCWVNADSLSNFITRADDASDSTAERIGLTLADGDVVRLNIDQSGTGNEDYAYGSTTVTTGVDYHVGFTFDSSDNRMRVYLNGIDDTIGTPTADNTGSVTVNFYIGARNAAGTAADFFNGRIGNANFWNRKLSDQDFTDLYNSGSGVAFPFSVATTKKIKISGTFQDKPIKTKVGGTFVDKPIKIKVGGTFQDA